MSDLTALNALLAASPRARRVMKAYIVKAFRKGFSAGQSDARQQFDHLLERMDRLKHLNGTTELFKDELHKAYNPNEARDERGKWSTSGGKSSFVASRSGRVEHPADKHGRTLAGRIREVPKAIRSKVTGIVRKKYAALVDKFGTTGAKAILGASVLMLPVPLPGASMIPIAIAHVVLKIRNLVRGGALALAKAVQGEPSNAELDRAAREFIAEIYAEMGEEPPEMPEELELPDGAELNVKAEAADPVALDDPQPDPEQPDDAEPHHALAAAMIEYAAEAREAGIDPAAGLDALAGLLDDPDHELFKAWNPELHPRDEIGRFAEKEAGTSARDKQRAASQQRREQKAASKEQAKNVLRRIRERKAVTADDILELRDHLPALTVEELRLQRTAAGTPWLGAKVKREMVDRLIDHAWEASGQERPGSASQPQKGSSEVGADVTHPRFGEGTILSVDRSTYSIPMAVVQFGSNKIVRPLSELTLTSPPPSEPPNDDPAKFPTLQDYMSSKMDEINAQVAKIREAAATIPNKENSDKYFKREMNDLRNKYYATYDKLKNDQTRKVLPDEEASAPPSEPTPPEPPPAPSPAPPEHTPASVAARLAANPDALANATGPEHLAAHDLISAGLRNDLAPEQNAAIQRALDAHHATLGTKTPESTTDKYRRIGAELAKTGQGTAPEATPEPVTPVTPASTPVAPVLPHQAAATAPPAGTAPVPDDSAVSSARAHLDRMREWQADRPGSIAAEEAVGRAEAMMARLSNHEPDDYNPPHEAAPEPVREVSSGITREEYEAGLKRSKPAATPAPSTPVVPETPEAPEAKRARIQAEVDAANAAERAAGRTPTHETPEYTGRAAPAPPPDDDRARVRRNMEEMLAAGKTVPSWWIDEHPDIAAKYGAKNPFNMMTPAGLAAARTEEIIQGEARRRAQEEAASSGPKVMAGAAQETKPQKESPAISPTTVDKPTNVGNTTPVVQPPKSGGGEAGGGKMKETAGQVATPQKSRSELASHIVELISSHDPDYRGKIFKLKDGRIAVSLIVRHPNPKRGEEEKGIVYINPDGSVVPDNKFSFALKVGSDKTLRERIEAMTAAPDAPTERAHEEPLKGSKYTASQLAQAARDHRRGKPVSDDDLLVDAVRFNYLTEGEAMNRDY